MGIERGTCMKQAYKLADVTPDISLMKKMASISGSIPSRLMELIDNAVDARIEGEVLHVDVTIGQKGKKQWITVADDGVGMTVSEAERFFRLGDSQKQGNKKIGRFGLGSKVAILGLGDTCHIETSPLHETYSVQFDFDIHRFRDWKVQYVTKEKKEDRHGTVIQIHNLTIRIGKLEKFTERLHDLFAKAYKHFIESGTLVLNVNNRTVRVQTLDLIPGLYQEFDFTIEGRRVYGWAGATKQAGTNWRFGFDLISNGRIIKANDFLSRQAHPTLARLTGEIHLDEFETDIHKTDFMRDGNLFHKMQEKLIGEILTDLLGKISRLTNREVFERYQGDMVRISKVLNKIVTSKSFLDNIDIETGVFKQLKARAKAKAKEKPLSPTQAETEEKELLRELTSLTKEFKEPKKPPAPKKRHGFVIEEPVGVSAGVDMPPRRWVVDKSDEAAILTVEVNLDHPSYQEKEGESASVFMKNAVLESVAEFILTEEKSQSDLIEDEIERFNCIKDMLIRHSLAR